jgi:hypothetical protein
MIEYQTITVKIKGARSGLASFFQSKSFDEESFKYLQQLGKQGWEVASCIPITHGALNSVSTDAAILILKRQKDLVQPQDAVLKTSLGNVDAIETSLSGDDFDHLLARNLVKSESRSSLSEYEMGLASEIEFPEAIPAIESMIGGAYRLNNQDAIDKIKSFYGKLSIADAAQSLYRLVLNRNDFDIAFTIMSDLGILEVDMIEKVFEQDKSLPAKNRLLKLFWIKKKTYQKQVDANIFKNLKILFVSAFPLIPARESKTIFGKMKNVWTCGVCNTDNEVEYQQSSATCSKCLSDQYGVQIENGGYREVMQKLDRRIAVLSSL